MHSQHYTNLLFTCDSSYYCCSVS